MTCRQCQRQLAGFARFCPRCGAAVRRPNRVARLTVALLLVGGFGFFLLVGTRSSSHRRVNYQQYPGGDFTYPGGNFQPTHQTWPSASPRNGSIQFHTPDGRIIEVEREIEQAVREVERRRMSNR